MQEKIVLLHFQLLLIIEIFIILTIFDNIHTFKKPVKMWQHICVTFNYISF